MTGVAQVHLALGDWLLRIYLMCLPMLCFTGSGVTMQAGLDRSSRMLCCWQNP